MVRLKMDIVERRASLDDDAHQWTITRCHVRLVIISSSTSSAEMVTSQNCTRWLCPTSARPILFLSGRTRSFFRSSHRLISFHRYRCNAEARCMKTQRNLQEFRWNLKWCAIFSWKAPLIASLLLLTSTTWVKKCFATLPCIFMNGCLHVNTTNSLRCKNWAYSTYALAKKAVYHRIQCPKSRFAEITCDENVSDCGAVISSHAGTIIHFNRISDSLIWFYFQCA